MLGGFAGLFIILATGFLVAWIIYDVLHDPHKKSEEAQEKPYIEDVREAAFAVIEASLLSEPEKWEPQFSKDDLKKVHWIVNHEAGLAILLFTGPENLFILQGKNGKFSSYPFKSGRLEPPRAARNAIFKAAMQIVSGVIEEKEIKSLTKMVSLFDEAKNRKAANDKAAE